MITFWATIMVLASIGIVGWPLLKGPGRVNGNALEDTAVAELLAQKDATLFDISELESDYNMGNLSQGDYRELRQRYEEKAVVLLKTVDKLRDERDLSEVSGVDAEIEARVAAMRARENKPAPGGQSPTAKSHRAQQPATGISCPKCGAKLDVGDMFCFRCGAASKETCPKCSAAVDADDIFCARCGTVLNGEGSPEAK